MLAVGDLEVYKAFDGELCAGTMRRMELHIDGLAELFDIEPPRARVFLYGDAASVAAVCESDSVPVPGCAPWWGANAYPGSLRHELVHVFVAGATDRARTRPFLEEGVAWRLQGDPITSLPTGVYEEFEPFTLDDLRTMIAERSPLAVPTTNATLFAAWVIDELGTDALLDAHLATSKLVHRSEPAADEEVELVLAQSLGFASLEDLYAAYMAGAALSYPPMPDTVHTFAAEELAAGVPVDLSCAGEHTEGPMSSDPSDELVTTFNLEIRRAGEHELTAKPFFRPHLFNADWQPVEPVFESSFEQAAERLDELGIMAQGGVGPFSCPPSPTSEPGERELFVLPGRYAARVTPSPDERVTATVIARDLRNDNCFEP